MKEVIKKLTKKNFKKTLGFRKHLHMYPELSFQEKETSKYISEVLKSAGIKHSKGWAKHGIVAEIGSDKGVSIALRADIDALPIQEANKVRYKSKHDGIMHACGHDVHTSSLLGAALILKSIESELKGKVYCIFQPGEEKLPGGASILIKEGLLNKIKPASIIGQHVHPPLEVGKLGFKSGTYMASADEIYLTIKGKGGHAALPHNCIDPIYIGSEIIIALQSIVARSSNPIDTSVLSIGSFQSVGGTTNVIPDEVRLEGTFRAMNEKWRKKAHKLIKRTAQNIAKAHGAQCDVIIKVGYPCLINNDDITSRTRQHAIDYLGKRQVVELPIRMTAEDFSYYSQLVPACFYRLGTGNTSKGITSPVHTPTFDIDEEALLVGSGFMAYNAIMSLK